MDGFSLGTWLNNNQFDAQINGPANDRGNDGWILAGTAGIPLAHWSGLLVDGKWNFFFDYSHNITDFVPELLLDFAEVRVRYEAKPSMILLFGSRLAGLNA